MLLDHYAKAVSPLLTPLFVRCKVTPNGVTVIMIVSGVLGALLFAIPWMPSRICGALFIQLWMILDCCDGEVARITRVFSKFGTQMDYLAHVICHPLFCAAFASALLALHRYNSTLILYTALLGVSAEMLVRHFVALSETFQVARGNAAAAPEQRSQLRTIVSRLLGIAFIYPNFALLFPLAYLVDYYRGTSIAFYFLIAQACLSFLVAARQAIFWTKVLYRT
ncbi:MAG: CDP-alcohol phosphatidyltransferase family protein [Terracidiphilus sp.]